MMKYIKKIPIIHHNIKTEDLKKINFPMVIEDIYDLRFVNKKKGTYLTYRDDALVDLSGLADVEDRVYIVFSIRGLNNILITLEISEIFYYAFSLNRWFADKRSKRKIRI